MLTSQRFLFGLGPGDSGLLFFIFPLFLSGSWLRLLAAESELVLDDSGCPSMLVLGFPRCGYFVCPLQRFFSCAGLRGPSLR